MGFDLVTFVAQIVNLFVLVWLLKRFLYRPILEVIEKRQGLKVACLEGIAYRNGWISEVKMRELAKPMLKNQYGQYLMRVIDEMKEEVNSGTLVHV